MQRIILASHFETKPDIQALVQANSALDFRYIHSHTKCTFANIDNMIRHGTEYINKNFDDFGACPRSLALGIGKENMLSVQLRIYHSSFLRLCF